MASQKEINSAWENAAKIRGENPDVYRKDIYGNKIRRASQGKLTDLGWEVDHIKPKAKGGSNDLSNLQALQWKANRKKSDEVKK